MVSSGRLEDLAALRRFTPLGDMQLESLKTLASRARRLQAPKGRLLFREGEAHRRTYYLLSGTVELLSEGEVVSRVDSGTPRSKQPLAHVLPRPYSAVVASDRIEYVLIDGEFLDAAETRDRTESYQVTELCGIDEDAGGADDWMTALLRTRAFHKVPPAHIQAVFLRLQRVDYRAGDVVIKQDGEGDYFYVVVTGRCVVTRETPLNREGIRLAELSMGDTFGEEALISGAPRNATVAMLTDGCLMRLAPEDFRQLLYEPLLSLIDYTQAREVTASGGQWIDVRLPSEFEQYRANGAINIPLHSLRLKMKSLDRTRRYVVCCDTGRRSSACGYLMSERGFDASVLRGGLGASATALNALSRP